MINTGEKIKSLRKEFGLTQEQLARAIFVENATISQYENQKRIPSLDTMEQIANVFGYTIDLNLIEKKEAKKDVNFYKEKEASEISNMSKDDLVEYIFVTQSNEIISSICKTTVDIVELLPLVNVKELISKRIESMDRLAIYFKINKIYPGVEEEMADFINNVKYHLENISNLDKEIVDKSEYIYLDTYFCVDGCDYGDGYYYFNRVELVDKNKKLLTDDINDINGDILPLDDSLNSKVGEYLMEMSPGLIQLNY